jgi:NAD-dependent deacetylase
MNEIVIPMQLIEALKKAQRVAILTGAGISAESGIPTFRDQLTGLWAKFRPEELATSKGFLRNPRMVWEWYASRREKVYTVEPNAGHYALAELASKVPELTLVTQNVDGLHQRAGSEGVIELHGNINRVKCFDEGLLVDCWNESQGIPPRCPRCGGFLRPDVVWFGEMLPDEAFEKAEYAARKCDVFFSIGTSGQVEPAASLARIAHGIVITINLEVESLISPYRYNFNGKAGEILPLLVQKL